MAYNEESARGLIKLADRDIPYDRGQYQGAYGQYNQGLQNTLNGMGQTQDYLRGQMQGQNSLSQVQLQQGLTQNQAQQRSMAAGAAPQNSAMAARTAANNSARLGYGMSGQAAMAGIQERNAAAQALNQSQLQQGQLQGQAMNANGQLLNQNYANQMQAYKDASSTDDMPWYGKASVGLLSALPMLFSDERLKTNVSKADDASKHALGRLNAVSYDYKNQKHGAGRQFGIMAQDLEKAGLGNTIIETREGKAVNTGRLTLANTAMLSSLHKRLAALEADDDGDED